MYKMSDYMRQDWQRYFVDTFVRYVHKGVLMTGAIRGLTTANKVVIDTLGTVNLVPMEDIQWGGLSQPRCVALGVMLMFISPSGARVMKKTPSGDNLSAVCYRNSSIPILIGRDSLGGSMSEKMILAYLQPPQEVGITTEEVEELMNHSLRPIVLSHTVGMFYDQDVDQWAVVDRGFISQYLKDDAMVVVANLLEAHHAG
jgi:hypothetical protein